MFGIKTKIIRFSAVVLSLSVLLSGCTKGGDSAAISAYKPATVVVWSVWDDQQDLAPLLAQYRAAQPNVTIEYKKFRYEEYEKELLNALAEDRGPDIFAVHNTWTRDYKAKLTPMPAAISLPRKYIEGTVKKEEVVKFVTRPVLTPNDVRKKFVDVVAGDALLIDEATKQEAVYGLPLSVDTLALYYNNDLLKNAGIAEPPADWDQFAEQVKKITKIDSANGAILVSGAALGTAKNVSRYFDILSALMRQNGAVMISEKGDIAFDRVPDGFPRDATAPAVGALNYYTQFAVPAYEGYCWNDAQADSLAAFAQGKVAFFFGYAYQQAQIKARAPKLNFKIAPLPQINQEKKINYANYWLYSVSAKSKNKTYSWDLVRYLADEKNVEAFLTSAKKPTALRSTAMINKQLADAELQVFAEQLLTAESWYRGYDSATAEAVFAEMIEAVVAGDTAAQAIKLSTEKIQQTLYK